MKTSSPEGAENNLAVCTVCGKINKIISLPADKNLKCARCSNKIFFRKKESITKTWAFLAAALIFYIPANIQPIMFTNNFGDKSSQTIITGVISLLNADLWLLAAIVFTASVAVPLAKILVLIILLVSVHFKWDYFYEQRTKMFFIVDIIGKWSMLDVFLISLMTGAVKLGTIAEVTPGPALRSFTAVVILTMAAAATFDTRLIWDNKNDT